MGRLRVRGNETYRWELLRASRAACERGEGDGSHRALRPSQDRVGPRNEETEGEGVTKALRLRCWSGKRWLWGVGGVVREGAGEVREEEREGGGFNESGT